MNNHTGKAGTPINLRALELIRDAFENSPLTQEALAKNAGVPRSTLANILSRTGEPRLVNIDWFTRLATALDADAGDWMDELEKVARTDSTPVIKVARSVRVVPRGAARKRSGDVPRS